MELIVGPRLFSTWSLRPWLVLRRAGAVFDTREVWYRSEAEKAELRRLSPSGFVPLLKVEGETIWDTLSISEWAAERYPEAHLWPVDPIARALARSATAEMHSGFHALRDLCGMGPDHPMAGDARSPAPSDPGLDRDLARLVVLWTQMRERFGAGGPWLFGDWSIADAFFTPVAARVRHYQIDLSAHGDDGTAAAYVAALLDQPHFREWEAAALSSNVD
ncbi:glutathione S-transferase [Brevundimonas diminuta]|jgi:glutathione S-transferase|uniref:glutathione S-transferase n=1 Tax=Brevundimonas diminuta TaxID=293 RepID=UPI0035DECC98